MKKIYIILGYLFITNIVFGQLNLNLVVKQDSILVYLDGPYNSTFSTLNFEIQAPSGVNLTIVQNPFNSSIDPVGGEVFQFSYSDVTNPIPVVDFNQPQLIAKILATGGTVPYNFTVQLNDILYAEIGADAFFINGSASGASDFIAEITLPIKLQSFTAKKFAANTSLLEWTTAREDNASHIEIERSMNAKSWSYVATEKARGSLNYSTDYSFVDAEAVLQRDRFTTVYYRLKLVDNDGSSEYSEVRSVTFDNNGIVSLEAYPNPSTEVINLRMAVGETNTNTAQMMMLDMTGKLVKKQTVSANGISVLEVDQLETGVYNIIVKHEDKTYQKRVIKTN